MATIGANLQAVKNRISRAASASGRRPQDIGLIAVSKGCDVSELAAAHNQGQSAFGESYLQEALEKIILLRDARDHSAGVASPEGPLLRPLEWHFLGPIQSNKTRAMAENFDWVHSVDRLKIAERLSAARPSGLARLQICLQVNIADEPNKSGVAPADALVLARCVAALPRLELRGLMAIPPLTSDQALQRGHFAALRQLKDELANAGIALDTLSMGMSEDLEAAISEGATLVRVGTAIFGPRQEA